MYKKNKILPFLLLWILSFPALAQYRVGFQHISFKKNITVPFQFVNNLILVPVVVNGVELTFMVDSGVDETILFSLGNKEIRLNNVKKIKLKGLGNNTEMDGLLSHGNKMIIAQKLIDSLHKIIVALKERYFYQLLLFY